MENYSIVNIVLWALSSILEYSIPLAMLVLPFYIIYTMANRGGSLKEVASLSIKINSSLDDLEAKVKNKHEEFSYLFLKASKAASLRKESLDLLRTFNL